MDKPPPKAGDRVLFPSGSSGTIVRVIDKMVYLKDNNRDIFPVEDLDPSPDGTPNLWIYNGHHKP